MAAVAWGWVVLPALVGVLLLPPQGADLLLAKAAAVMGAFGMVSYTAGGAAGAGDSWEPGRSPGRAQLEAAERDLG
ncbi:MAG: hypothetical protein ACYCS9_06495 [Candidatus Dormibacteria bacterium]